MTSAVQKLFFESVLDDFGHGEPIEYLIDTARKEFPAMSPRAVLEELRKAVDDGLMRVWFVSDDGSEREPSDAHYAQAVATYVPNEGPTYLIADSLVATLTCRGRAVWRTFAEPWQLAVSKHGRVIDDQPGELTVMAECAELARQLLAEWLRSHPGKSVEEPPSVGSVNYSLSPGFPESGKRMTWRLTIADDE